MIPVEPFIIPTQLGFAGGFALGGGSSGIPPLISPYVQVSLGILCKKKKHDFLISADLSDATKCSAYFSFGKMNIGGFIAYFVPASISLPSWLVNLVSFDSIVRFPTLAIVVIVVNYFSRR